jgi:hypothetical protein
MNVYSDFTIPSFGIHVTTENSSLCTLKETNYVFATKPSRLVLFRQTVAVYYENHTENTNTFCGQNAEFYYVKAGGTYSDHWALQA